MSAHRPQLERTRDLTDRATRDALVTGYESLPSLQLPDENDRHVLAATIPGRCDVIATVNLKDFPDVGLTRSQSTRSILMNFCAII